MPAHQDQFLMNDKSLPNTTPQRKPPAVRGRPKRGLSSPARLPDVSPVSGTPSGGHVPHSEGVTKEIERAGPAPQGRKPRTASSSTGDRYVGSSSQKPNDSGEPAKRARRRASGVGKSTKKTPKSSVPGASQQKSHKRSRKDRDDESGEDGNLDQGGQKGKPAEASDNRPTCIYYNHDDQVFNKAHPSERYGACKSRHRYTSTLIDHLARVHHFVIDKRYLLRHVVDRSSQHLIWTCRNCWESGYGTENLEEHLKPENPCEELELDVRGTAEKLLHAYCTGLSLPPPPFAGPPAFPPSYMVLPDDRLPERAYPALQQTEFQQTAQSSEVLTNNPAAVTNHRELTPQPSRGDPPQAPAPSLSEAQRSTSVGIPHDSGSESQATSQSIRQVGAWAESNPAQRELAALEIQEFPDGDPGNPVLYAGNDQSIMPLASSCNTQRDSNTVPSSWNDQSCATGQQISTRPTTLFEELLDSRLRDEHAKDEFDLDIGSAREGVGQGSPLAVLELYESYFADQYTNEDVDVDDVVQREHV